jgi:TIR domain
MLAKIRKGRTAGLPKVPDTRALNGFVSYSHVDEPLKSDLLKHLEPLRHLNLIEVWYDRQIKAGDEWVKTISTNLEKADIILLLISIDFINSKYCYGTELERALELHASRKARVVPIILRSCLWSYTPFAKFQALPKDAKAVSTWTDRDEALMNVAEGIKQIADDLLKPR